MGKARIVSGGTEGNYTVEILHNRERIDAEIERIDKDLAVLEPKIAEKQEALFYAELEVAEAKMLADALIDRLEEEGALPPVDLVRLVQLHNQYRASNGRGALVAVDKLNAAAQAHADDLAANNLSGHGGSNGSTPAQRIQQIAGYTGAVGENVAVGTEPPEENPLQAWINSPSHRSNMLTAEWQHIGLGYACRPDGRRHFWVAVFGDGAAASAQSPAAPSNCVGQEQDGPRLIQEAIEELAAKAKARDIAELGVTLLTAKQIEAQDRKRALQSIPPDPTRQAWCADYTENLSGQVGTAEIPGEGNTRVIVRPGYDGRATVDPARDGQLFHRRGLTGAQAYFNAAILPGWQKFKPTYRVGTLTAINEAGDTASVNLDSEQSSAQALGVNQSSSLTNVPVEYMECNAEAFEVGDRVLVEFENQDWGSPKVIGFESEPKECPGAVVIIPVFVHYRFAPINSVGSSGGGIGPADCYPPLPEEGEWTTDAFGTIGFFLATKQMYCTTDQAKKTQIMTAATADDIDFDALEERDGGPSRKMAEVDPRQVVEVPRIDLSEETESCFVNGTWEVGTVVRPDGITHEPFIGDKGQVEYRATVRKTSEAAWYKTVSGTTKNATGWLSKSLTDTGKIDISHTVTVSTLPSVVIDGVTYNRDIGARNKRWIPGDWSRRVSSEASVPGGLRGYLSAYLDTYFLVLPYKRA